MKFVDEATIRVIAGKGGNGALSFLREKYRPKGGPDGGDGGNGGSIFLVGESGLNTLADFRFTRQYKAQSGEGGAGKDRFGKYGEDLMVRVPLGTIVTDAESGEQIGDVTRHEERLLVAQGGFRGLGNARFKSSVNQTPRKTTNGTPGDERLLKLELKVLADVGLLGLPNAGKSTFLSAVSSARPRVADYPFTTLHPQLGVVDVGEASGFVIADIPGLIAGAAQGVGLGIGFLKHLNRTRILLHLVDSAPLDGKDVIESLVEIEKELVAYGEGLADRERWIVLNKIDLLGEDEVSDLRQRVRDEYHWQGQIHCISAATSAGCKPLTGALMERLDRIDEEQQTMLENADVAEEQSSADSGDAD